MEHHKEELRWVVHGGKMAVVVVAEMFVVCPFP